MTAFTFEHESCQYVYCRGCAERVAKQAGWIDLDRTLAYDCAETVDVNHEDFEGQPNCDACGDTLCPACIEANDNDHDACLVHADGKDVELR